jgi:hypothetical protein
MEDAHAFCCRPNKLLLPPTIPATPREERLREGKDSGHHKVRIYKEYHSVCPLVGIGTTGEKA